MHSISAGLVGPDQGQQVLSLAGFQIGDQQVEHVLGAAHQGRLCVFGLQRTARVANVLKAETLGHHHHHAGRTGFDSA